MIATKVLLATHNASARRTMRAAVSRSQDIKIVATASNLMETYNSAEDLKPDIAIIDYALTRLEEFEMILALFGVLDIRWLSIGAEDDKATGPVTFNHNSGLFALEADDRPDLIVSTIKSLASVAKQKTRVRAQPISSGNRFGKSFVMIGASTGGVDALSTLLSNYPEDCPPTFIVQHTGKSFGAGLVNLLDRRCPARVCGAKDGVTIGAGQVCVLAGQALHMQLKTERPIQVRLVPGQPISGHIPSIDAMFQSALPKARDAVAVLLTGMGKDGANGLLELRNAGARTIAQDEETSVVYGMPRVAWEIGAAEKQLPVTNIAGAILEMCESRIQRARAG